MYEPTPAESAWARATARPAAAVLCVPAAAAVNRLDADLIAPLLAEGCTYGSQGAIEEFHGRDAVLGYLTGKLETLRDAGPRGLLTAELGTDPNGAPCP